MNGCVDIWLGDKLKLMRCEEDQLVIGQATRYEPGHLAGRIEESGEQFVVDGGGLKVLAGLLASTSEEALWRNRSRG